MGGNCGGNGPIALHVPALIPMIRMVINIKRIALLRITFSPSELSRAVNLSRPYFFSYNGPRRNQQGDKGARARGGNPRAAGILSRAKANSCYFHVKPAKTESESLTQQKTYEYVMLSSSSGFAGSAASGVKSDDKCAPASNIRPEMNAQNMSATEIENACP